MEDHRGRCAKILSASEQNHLPRRPLLMFLRKIMGFGIRRRVPGEALGLLFLMQKRGQLWFRFWFRFLVLLLLLILLFPVLRKGWHEDGDVGGFIHEFCCILVSGALRT